MSKKYTLDDFDKASKKILHQLEQADSNMTMMERTMMLATARVIVDKIRKSIKEDK